MSQVTVHLPGAVLEAARKRAREQHRRERVTEWPDDLKDLLRRGSADLVEPDDPPPRDPAPAAPRPQTSGRCDE